MRCTACNVDLAESSRICPLCGAAAVEEDAVLSELKEAPYPVYEEEEDTPKQRKRPSPHFLRFALIVSAFCALIGSRPLWTTIAPLLLIAASVIYFCAGLKEKSSLLHAGIALLVSLICQFLFFLNAVINGFQLSQILFSMLVCLILFLILYFKNSDRFEDQFDAVFHL